MSLRGAKRRPDFGRSTRDRLVTGYEGLIPTLELPDPDDRHVLAAAIVSRCDVNVTQNLKGFPDSALEPYGTVTLYPLARGYTRLQPRLSGKPRRG